ncbi:hypothetical protein PMAYCL1PPCAC_01566, partial [Pristionchus mayeri]
DNSNFVLRWVINNARAVHAAGKAESEEFNEGGFKWIAAFEKRDENSERGYFSLRCGLDYNGSWNCKALVQLSVFDSDGSKNTYDKNRISFHNDSNFVKADLHLWNILNDPVF